MSPEQTAIILDQLAVNWDKVLEPELLPLWAHELRGVDWDVALESARHLMSTSIYFPKLAEMNMAVAAEIRVRAKEAEKAVILDGGPDRGCVMCEGRIWYQADDLVRATANGEVEVRYEMWKPCQSCAPLVYSRWVETREEAKAMSRYRRGSDTDWDTPKVAIHEARARLEGEEP